MALTPAEALDLFRSDDLIGIAMQADAVRRRMHPDAVVPYTVALAIPCGDPATASAAVGAATDRGASAICLTGAGALAYEDLSRVIATLRRDSPDLWIEALPAAEAAALAAASGHDLTDLLARLRNVGLDSLLAQAPPCADAAPLDTWFEVHTAAHRAGVQTVAVLSFGAGESLDSRVAALARIDDLQQQTGGFAAFVAEPVAAGLSGPTAVDSLKTLAIARLMLGSIEHVCVTHRQGLKVLETGLRFGANDAGQLLVPAGAPPDLREEDLRRVIRDAGFRPAERTRGHSALFAF